MKIQIQFDRVEHSFRRKQINHIAYLKRLVIYIHMNPVHHYICDHPIEYPWSSYETCLSSKNTELMRQVVVDWFTGQENFKQEHQTHIDKWQKHLNSINSNPEGF